MNGEIAPVNQLTVPAGSVTVSIMSKLAALAAQIIDGSIEVIDLTSPLHSGTPILQLPPQWGQTRTFELEEISRYDDRGPAWYWNNFRTGEHTGTHLDAPNHWVTGKDLPDVSQIPPSRLIGPAVVIDRVAEATMNPDYLLDVKDLEDWQQRHGPLPRAGWLLFRTGWSVRGDDPERAFVHRGDGGEERGRALDVAVGQLEAGQAAEERGRVRAAEGQELPQGEGVDAGFGDVVAGPVLVAVHPLLDLEGGDVHGPHPFRRRRARGPGTT